MPKIIDHDAHRADLALKAASYFSEHGYGGVSMRNVAAHLGVSKSALYHYFPTKEALFLASTKAVMLAVAEPTPPSKAGANRPTDPNAQLAQLQAQMAPSFGAEMALLFDYLRGKSAPEIANDEAMQLAMTTYRTKVTEIVGASRCDDVLAALLGRLLLDYLSGRESKA